MSNDDTRDRVIRMETELKALKEDVEDMRHKVDKIHEMMTEANGVRKAISFLVMLSKVGLVAGIIAVANWLAAKLGISP